MFHYALLRRLLFHLEPERAHYLALRLLLLTPRPLFPQVADKPIQVMGLNFPNPVGLAAGFDRSGDYVNALAKLGFGFIEVGTLTLNPQSGHPQPRIFRLPKKRAIINRMGFYNKGIDYFEKKVSRVNYDGILGVNIVKNFHTPNDQAIPDYIACLQRVYRYADYVAVNISSPNTPHLRQLQTQNFLPQLLEQLKNTQSQLAIQHQKYVPLVIKVAPDLTSEDIESMAQLFLQFSIDGVIATNTTLARPGLNGIPHADKIGGLSGAPLHPLSLNVIKQFSKALKTKIPIIGVGGILTARNAFEMLDAGASLVQLYTGLIYTGPKLVSDIINAYAKRN